MAASEKLPTAMALVMARVMKRLAVKYADLGLARSANYLEKEALSALKNRQSALRNPREINYGPKEPLITPAHDPKPLKGPVRSPNPLDEDLRWGDLLIEAAKEALERKKAKAAKD